ncbi:phage tail tape measure protein [Pseudomonas sp. GG8]
MAKNLSLGLEIGGAVSPTVGAAFKDVENRIKQLSARGDKARVLQNTIGDTIRLRDEWKKAHDTGAAGADKLLGKLESNLNVLRKQGVEVGRLSKAYQTLGRTARSADLKAKGYQQIEAGKSGLKNTVGQAVAGGAAMAIPTKVSADYGAIVRDIAIKAGIANKPQEAQMSRTIISTSRDTGMARNDVAEVVNALVGAGMELSKALEYAPSAAKFVVGQGADGADTAKMINALGQNAKITDAKDMQKALEAIAYQGQAGSFEASDMAKWFPELLAGMGKLGITGNDSVAQLGALLQVQMKTAGSSDEAANNLKNWMEKIGSGDTVAAYKKVGIDYQGSMQTGLQKGMSTLESSFALAQRYIEATDPKKAAAMAEATAKISQEADPAKAKQMMASLEQALRTGDLFSDMQVKAALTAFTQNKALYEQLKKDAGSATGILDKNLAERREASAQKWSEMAQSMDDAMRSIGDSLRPVTDAVADGITSVARSLTVMGDESPKVVSGIAAVGAGFIALRTGLSALKIGRGLLNLGKGSLMGNPNIPQKVIVMNPSAGGGVDGSGGADAGGKKTGGKGGRSAGSRQLVEANTAVKGAAVFAVVDAAVKAKDTYDNATTRDEKAQGYGEAAGGLAGTLAGAAAGAAIGSMVPVIGTIVGGLIGGYLGSMGGNAAGGYLGKKAFGTDPALKHMPLGGPLMMADAGKAMPGPAVPSLAVAAQSFKPLVPSMVTTRTQLQQFEDRRRVASPAGGSFDASRMILPEAESNVSKPGDVVRSMMMPQGPGGASATLMRSPAPVAQIQPPKIDQQMTFAPVLSVTVQGDVKDPRQLARELEPYMRQQFDDLNRQMANRNLFDAPHVG